MIDTKVVYRGTTLWRREKAGPRGGREVLWQYRFDSEAAPSDWRVWCETAREAAAGPLPVGTGAGV